MGGSNCAINDLETVMRFNRLCDDLGLDTMSAGATIALVITSYSIHYTKLYDNRTLSFMLLSFRITLCRPAATVITSYSIHYTKLYDLCLASGLVLAPILAHSTVSWLTRPTHPRSDRVTAASRVLPAAGQTTGTTH